MYYSSTQFLKDVKEASTSKLKLKHLLILASRLLFIAFLVFAFAQPFIPARQQSAANSDVYIYLDNSFSMTNQVGIDYSALDAGLSFINKLPGLFPTGTNFKFFTNDFASYSNFFKSGNELIDLTTEIGATGSYRSFDEVWSRITSSMESNARGGDIFWISDFQKSTMGKVSGEKMDSLQNLNIFPLDFESTSNLFIDSVYLQNPFILGSEKVTLNIVISNSGVNDVNGLPIKVFLNDVQNSSATVDIPAQSKAEFSFDLGFNLKQINTGRINIEDYPVTFDNDFYFTIDKGDKIKILEIRSAENSTVISNVYGNPELFDFHSYRFTNIDYSRIGYADLVVVNASDRFDASLSVMLLKYLSNGGHLVIIPSLHPDIDSYAPLISSRKLTSVDTVYQVGLAGPDTANPFYENVFEDVSGVISMPSASRVINWGADRTALLRFKNGIPFLSHLIGNGNVYIFAGPLNDAYSGVQNHAIFVPVMYKIAFGSKTEISDLYHTVDQPLISVNVDSVNQNTIIKMVSGDKELIPAQRFQGGKALLELPGDILEPGFYTITIDNKLLTTVAFNFDNKESVLQQVNAEELHSIFSNHKKTTIFSTSDDKEFESEVRKQYEGTPLWKIAIILALIFLLIEIMFIRFL